MPKYASQLETPIMKELYTEDNAVNDITSGKITGIDASIKKWRLINLALTEIYNHVNSDCGLCIEHYDDNRSACDTCPIGGTAQACTEPHSCYRIASTAINNATDKARLVLSMLRDLENKPMRKTWTPPEYGWGEYQDYFERCYNDACTTIMKADPDTNDCERTCRACEIAEEKTMQHITDLNIEIIPKHNWRT